MTRRTVEVRLTAEGDLASHYEWLLKEADASLAEAMLANATTEFQKLAQTPGLGALMDTAEPELIGTRKWRIKRFPNLLIFYQAEGSRLFINRVLHSAQNWLAELERG